MSIELRRARGRKLHKLRARQRRFRAMERRDNKNARAIAASIQTLQAERSSAPAGWLLAALGFYGLDAVEEGLHIGLLTGEPILLVGRHGTAKTAICCRLGEVLGLAFHAYDAAKALFEDVVGFPNPASLARGEVSYVPTPVSLWDKEFILVDELSRAQPQMQSKWLEVIRSRRLMGRELPKLRYIIAAMNPTDYLGAVPLDEALLSRFAVVLQMPEVVDMGEEIARQVICARSADDAPLLGDSLAPTSASQADIPRIRRRLRRRLSVARRQLSTVEEIFGQAVTRYVLEVSIHLAERGHAQDARRLGMVRRNILVSLALACGQRRLVPMARKPAAAGPGRAAYPAGPGCAAGSGSDPGRAFDQYGSSASEVSSIVGRTAQISLPFVADGRPGPSPEILATIHRDAFYEAFEAQRSESAPSQGDPGVQVLRGGHRMLRDYERRVLDLPLEEHYKVANALLQRTQAATPEQLLGAWSSLKAMGEIVRDHPGSVPWEVTEHLFDGIAAHFGLVETSASAMVSLCQEERIDPHRPGPARLARQCLARAGSWFFRGRDDDVGSLMRRLQAQGGDQ